MKYVVNLKNQIYTKILFYSRCYLTMTQALEDWLGESPFGLAGTGKTETVKCSGWPIGKICSRLELWWSLWLPSYWMILCLIGIKITNLSLFIEEFNHQLCRLCIWLKECKSLSWVQELLIFRNSKDVCNVSRRVVRRRCQKGRLILLDRLWKIQST